MSEAKYTQPVDDSLLTPTARETKNMIVDMVTPKVVEEVNSSINVAKQEISQDLNKDLNDKIATHVQIESFRVNYVEPTLKTLNNSEKARFICKEEIDAMSRFVENPNDPANFSEAIKSMSKIKRLNESPDNILVDRNVSSIDAYTQKGTNYNIYYPKNTHEVISSITESLSTTPKIKWSEAINTQWFGEHPKVNVFSAYNEPLAKLSNLIGHAKIIDGRKQYIAGTCSGVLTDREKRAYENRHRVVIPSSIFRDNYKNITGDILRVIRDRTASTFNEQDYMSAMNKVTALSRELNELEELDSNVSDLHDRLVTHKSKFGKIGSKFMKSR